MTSESSAQVNSSTSSLSAHEPQEQAFKVWAKDPGSFSSHRVCALRHNVHLHPLMQLESLQALAKVLLPKGQCRFIKPGSTVASRFEHAAASHDGRDIDDVFRRIEEPGSWVALYRVDADPRYRAFLEDVTASARQLVNVEQPGMFDVGGYIFISAPPSVTPFHIDRENNFWLQIAGRKTLNVWDHTDRATVSGRAVEEFIVNGSLDDVALTEDARGRSHEFDTGPGDGVYFPSTSPHMTQSDVGWTRPGDGVSISIGVVLYTDVTRRHAHLHALNRKLRQRGFSPTLPGESRLMDLVKLPLANALVSGSGGDSTAGGSSAPPRSPQHLSQAQPPCAQRPSTRRFSTLYATYPPPVTPGVR